MKHRSESKHRRNHRVRGHGKGAALQTRRQVAYHEAGHIVAHERCGHVNGGATIRPDGETLGRTHTGRQSLLDCDLRTAAGRRMVQQRVREQLLCLAAGYAAEVQAGYPRSLARRGASGDLAEMRELLWLLDEDGAAAIQRHIERAEEFVRKPRNWRAIEAVAAELLVRESIGGRRAQVLVRRADGRRPVTGRRPRA